MNASYQKICTRWFDNKQAVRAHLRFCPYYRAGQPIARPETYYECAECGNTNTSRRNRCIRCGSRRWRKFYM